MRGLSLLVVAAALLTTSCGGGGGSDGGTNPPPGSTVATISLSRDTATLVPRETTTIQATPKNVQGATVSGKTAHWSSSAGSIATVSQDGTISGVGAGTATITATVDGMSASANITVKDGALIGAAGGVAARPDSSVILTIPPGALAATQQITIAPVASPPSDTSRIGAAAYELGPIGTRFSHPVTIRIKYDASAIPAGKPQRNVALRHSVANVSETVRGTTVDSVRHEATASIESFGIYWLSELFSFNLWLTLQGSTDSIFTGPHGVAVFVGPDFVTRSTAAGLSRASDCHFLDYGQYTCLVADIADGDAVTLIATDGTDGSFRKPAQNGRNIPHDAPVTAADTMQRAGDEVEFTGWEGCTNDEELEPGVCGFYMDFDRDVTANFRPYRSLFFQKIGNGAFRFTVVAGPPGLTIPPTPANPTIGYTDLIGGNGVIAPNARVLQWARVHQGVSVRIDYDIAARGPNETANFRRWEGSCTGSGSCLLTFGLGAGADNKIAYAVNEYWDCNPVLPGGGQYFGYQFRPGCILANP